MLETIPVSALSTRALTSVPTEACCAQAAIRLLKDGVYPAHLEPLVRHLASSAAETATLSPAPPSALETHCLSVTPELGTTQTANQLGSDRGVCSPCSCPPRMELLASSPYMLRARSFEIVVLSSAG